VLFADPNAGEEAVIQRTTYIQKALYQQGVNFKLVIGSKGSITDPIWHKKIISSNPTPEFKLTKLQNKFRFLSKSTEQEYRDIIKKAEANVMPI
jgi:hypothetical protein